ncbi:uncharacterized protein LOC144164419 isoform X3 [Haemaphysalis longicornis]
MDSVARLAPQILQSKVKSAGEVGSVSTVNWLQGQSILLPVPQCYRGSLHLASCFSASPLVPHQVPLARRESSGKRRSVCRNGSANGCEDNRKPLTPPFPLQAPARRVAWNLSWMRSDVACGVSSMSQLVWLADARKSN